MKVKLRLCVKRSALQACSKHSLSRYRDSLSLERSVHRRRHYKLAEINWPVIALNHNGAGLAFVAVQ